MAAFKSFTKGGNGGGARGRAREEREENDECGWLDFDPRVRSNRKACSREGRLMHIGRLLSWESGPRACEQKWAGSFRSNTV